MKIRTGFVSNSSSSSFVVAYKASVPCPHCGRSDDDIIELIEDMTRNDGNCYDTSLEASGLKETITYVENEYCWDGNSGEKQKKSLINKVKKYNLPGWKFACISISNHDEIIKSMFNRGVKSGDIKVIQKD